MSSGDRNRLKRWYLTCRAIGLSAVVVSAFTSVPEAWPQAVGKDDGGFLVDSRDGQRYPVVPIGEMLWLGRNLNYAAAGSFCYDDLQDNCVVYGRLYRWETALSACPGGWHLSTEFEWQALERWLGLDADYLGNYGNRGTDQARRLKPGGDTEMNIVYGGWRRSEDGEFEALGEHAAFWESTDSSLDRAWHRDIDRDDDMIWRSHVIKQYALSVRCVRNWFEEDG